MERLGLTGIDLPYEFVDRAKEAKAARIQQLYAQNVGIIDFILEDSIKHPDQKYFSKTFRLERGNFLGPEGQDHAVSINLAVLRKIYQAYGVIYPGEEGAPDDRDSLYFSITTKYPSESGFDFEDEKLFLYGDDPGTTTPFQIQAWMRYIPLRYKDQD